MARVQPGLPFQYGLLPLQHVQRRAGLLFFICFHIFAIFEDKGIFENDQNKIVNMDQTGPSGDCEVQLTERQLRTQPVPCLHALSPIRRILLQYAVSVHDLSLQFAVSCGWR